MYGYIIWLAEGCHWYLLPRINLQMACVAWAKDATAACFDGGLSIPMQRISVSDVKGKI